MNAEIEMKARICALQHVLIDAGLATNAQFAALQQLYADCLEHEANESLKAAIAENPAIGFLMDFMGTPKPK